MKAVLALCFLALTSLSDAAELLLSVSTDGTYSLGVQDHNHNGTTKDMWISSAETYFHADNKKYSTADKSLQLLQSYGTSGQDKLGAWQTTGFAYRAGPYNVSADIKLYNNLEFIVFEQHYPGGLENTSAGDKGKIISAFPNFKIEGASGHLGYLSLGGMMTGDTGKLFGEWTNSAVLFNSGLDSGPLVLFDKTGRVMIIAPFNEFMAQSSYHDGDIGGSMGWGIMGEVNSVPAQFVSKTAVFFSDQGINVAFEKWGELMKFYYDRTDAYKDADLTINYLGYYTDNGAYYYYNTDPGKNYEDSLLGYYNYSVKADIPYRYMQLDSWWYYKGTHDGVKTWVSRPDIFPQGLESFYNKMGLPLAAHNRWWSNETTYATENGGDFEFLTDGSKAVPIEERFWQYLLSSSRRWGLVMYEQDWLNVEFKGVKQLYSDISRGKAWLHQMGESARQSDMTVQYCMSQARHAMTALEIPAVTQTRVSNDYHPGGDQWRIGVSSLFAMALGLAPFKDCFWTTTDQPGNKYGAKEPYPGLNTVVSVLSTGPVGPADATGKTNVSLLMRCCNEDGLILKPSRPATAIDQQFYQAAFKDGSGPTGEVWTTYSLISKFFFGNVLAADLQGDFKLTPHAAGFDTMPPSQVFTAEPSTKAVDPKNFSDSEPLLLSGCSKENFCLYHSSPVFRYKDDEVLILGELSKFVPMSPQRVKSIKLEGDILIELAGGQGEEVHFWFWTTKTQWSVYICHFSDAGTAMISFANKRCYPL